MSIAGVVVLETDQDYPATTMLFGKVVPVGDHYAALDHNGSVVGVVDQTEDGQWKWTVLDGTHQTAYVSLTFALERAVQFVGR